MMRTQLEQRLQALKAEFEEGQKMLADLEAKQTNLRSTLLRISGAIQVLEELLAQPSPDQEGSAGAPERRGATNESSG
jgi:predicted nuclease with TOPRIM domain